MGTRIGENIGIGKTLQHISDTSENAPVLAAPSSGGFSRARVPMHATCDAHFSSEPRIADIEPRSTRKHVRRPVFDSVHPGLSDRRRQPFHRRRRIRHAIAPGGFAESPHLSLREKRDAVRLSGPGIRRGNPDERIPHPLTRVFIEKVGQ